MRRKMTTSPRDLARPTGYGHNGGMAEDNDNNNDAETPEEEYPLVAPDSQPEVQDAIWFPGRSGEPDEPELPEGFQFSVGEMMMLTAVVALMMGTVGLFPGGYEIKNFAGVAGAGVLLGMIVLALMQNVRPIFRVGWWVMLGLYALACVAVVVRGT
ncbi:MAG: hypothetical protein HQ567_14365 [Candidatus Nealsonbacteria bacterium]|nr:hypothetical protein [Candidatus Nealsonbacteria bacterium]